jgi:hypothetical protein
VSKKPQKRRPEIMHPGLKQQTPIEKKETVALLLSNKKRWEHLLSLNKWVLIK